MEEEKELTFEEFELAVSLIGNKSPRSETPHDYTEYKTSLLRIVTRKGLATEALNLVALFRSTDNNRILLTKSYSEALKVIQNHHQLN